MPSVEERLQRAAVTLDAAIDEAVASAPSRADGTQLSYRLPPGRDRRRFTVALVSAAAIVAGVVGVAVVAGPNSDRPEPNDVPVIPVERLEPNTWTPFPPPPIEPRFQYVAVATDSGVFVWGGCCTDSPAGDFFRDGAYFDAASGSWRVLPESPLDPDRGDAIAAWTGAEVVVLNGNDGIQAAAFDPAAFSWRALTAPSGDNATSGSSELFALPDGRIAFVIAIYDDGLRNGVHVQIYDPSADQWTAAAGPRAELSYGVAVPASVLGVATSDANVGVLSVIGPDCSTLSLDTYSTTADSWTTTPIGTTDWHRSDIAGIDGGRFLLSGGTRCSTDEPDPRALIVDPSTGSVDPAADVPIPLVRGVLEGIWTGQWAIRLNGDGRPLAYDPAGDRWLVGASVLDASGAAADTVIWQTPVVWFDGQLVIASPGYERADTDGSGGMCCFPEREAWTYRFVPDADG
jgi:hypothetical protein